MAWIWRKNGILILLSLGQNYPLCDHPLTCSESFVNKVDASNLLHIRRKSYLNVKYDSKTIKVCHLIIETSNKCYLETATNFLTATKSFDLPKNYYYFFYKDLPEEEKKEWNKKFRKIKSYKILSKKKEKKK